MKAKLDFNSIVVEIRPVFPDLDTYHCSMDRITCFQCGSATTTASSVAQEADGNDVYYFFGGTIISDMLHLHCKHIKAC